jgi:hypothetical protein
MAKQLAFNRKHPPRSVMICGQKVAVKVVAYLEDEAEELLGAFNGETKTIYILKGSNWKQTLFHESIHAALYFSGAGEGLTISKEESIVLALEHGLWSLLFGG